MGANRKLRSLRDVLLRNSSRNIRIPRDASLRPRESSEVISINGSILGIDEPFNIGIHRMVTKR